MGNVLLLVPFGIFENFTLYFIYNTYNRCAKTNVCEVISAFLDIRLTFRPYSARTFRTTANSQSVCFRTPVINKNL
jgi:hypothetical protein